MSYTVLARKWRPKNFSELVGQTHVMQALANALDQQRLHHAYLFTGTRGVGKTTIARIFAKALNCEQGISSTPCGQCSVCTSIDEGRFVDLIEVDAASRTKVEDTREILDNVQYAPTQGRYKVYLIDEVHMLSKSSFNALLKTLEEPPEHVKFLLATTDPHKLPITVLSRCLQFNLLRLTSTQMQTHLANILQQEQIEFEPTALALIAKSADGSARDSLSLLDQAIAYCGGNIQFESVRTMLGLVDQGVVQAILHALTDESAEQVKQILQTLASLGVDYVALLNQLLESLHQIAQTQILGEALDEGALPTDVLADFAQQLSPEQVQLFYQIGLLARQDMALAPDVRIGFEMTLLRMLAFDPRVSDKAHQSGHQPAPRSNSASSEGGVSANASVNASAQTVARQSVTQLLKSAQAAQAVEPVSPAFNPAAQSGHNLTSADTTLNQPESVSTPAPKVSEPMADLSMFPDLQARVQSPNSPTKQPATHQRHQASNPAADVISPDQSKPSAFTNNAPNNGFSQPNRYDEPDHLASMMEQVPDAHQVRTVAEPVHPINAIALNQPPAESQMQAAMPPQTDPNFMTAGRAGNSVTAGSQPVEVWLDLIQQTQPDGMALELARHCVLVEHNHQAWWLSVHPDEMAAKTDMAVTRLEEAAQRRFGQQFRVNYVDYAGEFYTPSLYETDQKTLSQQQASESIYQDDNVQMLQERLGMQILEKTIQPI